MLGLGALVIQRVGHAAQRVDLWLDPWRDPDGSGYQIIQALIALASGGVLGAGLTYGYPEYVPAVHTDYVIVAIGEELGLVGALGTLGLYLIWLQRGLSIAVTSKRSFSALLAVGLTTVLTLQALVILGGTLRLFPLTGITLPLISYGGSSLLVNVLLMGLLLAISEERRGAASV
jgi:cell division protein FtsW (lipid II flippase)